MAKQYKLTRRRRTANKLATAKSIRGKGNTWVLTTTGRTSGQRFDTVITPAMVDDQRYLVAPYGAVSWVKNVRANPKATLSRGGASLRVVTEEVHDEEAARALAKYYAENEKSIRDYMDIPGDKTLNDFRGVADRYPVFRSDEGSGLV